LTPRQRQIRFFSSLAFGIFVFLLFFNEYMAWRRGSVLANEIDTERLTDMNAAWARYETIAKSSYLPVILSGVRGSIQSRLMSTADRVIAEYRNNDAPSVSETDWERARSSLARALQLDPDNNAIRGKMYLCEAHLVRIRASSTKLSQEARSRSNQEARARFEEARDLLPKSPDPYLGLARLYVYAFGDVDRAEEVLRAADKRGHEMSRREKAQLADGYRGRAERLMREADRATSAPEEKNYLNRAKQDYRRAEELYREIVPFGGAAASLRRIFEQLESIDGRLETIQVEAVPRGV
jgi:hypothetical protein